MTSPRIGDILLMRGLITQGQLEQALVQQRRTGERLGRVVLTLGMVTRLELARALAERWQQPFVMVTPDMVTPSIARRFPLDATLALRAVPLSDDGQVVLVASGEEPSDTLRDTLNVVYPGRHQDIRITTEWDIDRAIGIAHRREMVDASIHGLYFRHQEESAFRVFSPGQYLLIVLLLMSILVGLWMIPLTTMLLLTLLSALAFGGAVIFRMLVGLAETPTSARITVTPESLAALTERSLPTYSILVPFDREPAQVVPLLASLAALDYPVDKLDVTLLFHEEDLESLDAAKAAAPPDNIRFLVVPAGELHTKPMACNVGLLYAKGEFLVVLDAGDRPEPDQLRKAVVAFRRGPRRLACLQATRNARNSRTTFLSRFATIDQLFWLEHLLPGLDRWRFPVPIGGTSNHFRTEVLRELGGWDPFNVTEDADLGVRAAMHGHRVGTINSATSVVINATLLAWLRERTRWIKGYMQTALVFLRDPMTLAHRLGPRRTFGFAFLIAATPLGHLMQPVATGLTLLWIMVDPRLLVTASPAWAIDASVLSLLMGYAGVITIHLFTALRHRRYGLALLAPLAPLYWLLHSLAASAALVQLLLHPDRLRTQVQDE
ncbi:MAG TPA: glycosyltransferase [Gemmatimonadales bacterium]|nr:glycosyltransferase [Gemmatimonadales bacterium]